MKWRGVDWIPVIIIGVYTLVYVIVFVIQSSQLSKQKSIISSMETFVNIFKVDEVEKYVEMSRKNIMMDAAERLRESKEELRNDIIIPEIDKMKSDMNEQFNELAHVVYNVVLSLDKDEREEFYKNHLNKTADMFRQVLDEQKKP